MSISSIVTPEPEAPKEEQVESTPPVPAADTSSATTNTESSASNGNPTQEAVVVSAPAPAKDQVLEALLNKIQPVTKTRRKLKVLIYSDAGAGKSTLMGTAPNNLIIDVEDGLASLNNHPDMLGTNVQSIPYKSFEGLDMIIKKLQEAPPELDWIETFSVDSVSELHKRGLAEVTEREYAKNPISNSRYLAETEHHTENNEHIRRLVSSLRDLDRNIILTAHARTIEPKNQPAKTFPDFSEKLANTLAGIVDIVGYMYKKEVDGKIVRVMRFHGNGAIVAKTRIGGFPNEMVDPTWPKLMEIVNKNYEA